MKRSCLCLFTLTFFLLVLTSCKNETNSVDKAQHEEAVRKAIKQVWNQFGEKWYQGDATAIADLFTEDGINYSVNGRALCKTGRCGQWHNHARFSGNRDYHQDYRPDEYNNLQPGNHG